MLVDLFLDSLSSAEGNCPALRAFASRSAMASSGRKSALHPRPAFRAALLVEELLRASPERGRSSRRTLSDCEQCVENFRRSKDAQLIDDDESPHSRLGARGEFAIDASGNSAIANELPPSPTRHRFARRSNEDYRATTTHWPRRQQAPKAEHPSAFFVSELRGLGIRRGARTPRR